MVAAGFFENERIELIEGVLVEMSPQKPLHASVIQSLNRLLVPRLLGRADVRVQLPFAVSDDSLPEPDLALVRPETFAEAHPGAAFLIIEVADSSLTFDRREKAELYARAGVPEYWVVNLADRIIERQSEPASGAYLRVAPFRPGETTHLLAFPDVDIAVDQVFGAR